MGHLSSRALARRITFGQIPCVILFNERLKSFLRTGCSHRPGLRTSEQPLSWDGLVGTFNEAVSFADVALAEPRSRQLLAPSISARAHRETEEVDRHEKPCRRCIRENQAAHGHGRR